MSDVKTTPTEKDAPTAKAAPAAPKPVKTTIKKKPVTKSKATAKKKVGKPAEPKLKTAKPQQAAKLATASAPTETSFFESDVSRSNLKHMSFWKPCLKFDCLRILSSFKGCDKLKQGST